MSESVRPRLRIWELTCIEIHLTIVIIVVVVANHLSCEIVLGSFEDLQFFFNANFVCNWTELLTDLCPRNENFQTKYKNHSSENWKNIKLNILFFWSFVFINYVIHCTYIVSWSSFLLLAGKMAIVIFVILMTEKSVRTLFVTKSLRIGDSMENELDSTPSYRRSLNLSKFVICLIPYEIQIKTFELKNENILFYVWRIK